MQANWTGENEGNEDGQRIHDLLPCVPYPLRSLRCLLFYQRMQVERQLLDLAGPELRRWVYRRLTRGAQPTIELSGASKQMLPHVTYFQTTQKYENCINCISHRAAIQA